MKVFTTTKQRRVFLPLMLSVLLCLACGCGAAELDPDANVFIVFDSAAEVRTVSLTYANADAGAQYADGARRCTAGQPLASRSRKPTA